MLKIIIDKTTKKEYSISIDNIDGENSMICPVCSHERKKSTQQCLCFNSSIHAGRCNHCSTVFFEKRSNAQTKFKALQKEGRVDLEVRKYFNKRGLDLTLAKQYKITGTSHYFKEVDRTLKCICFNYLNGEEIFYKKFKTVNKKFSSEGKGLFYNHNALVNAVLFEKEPYIIITEGEDDCLSYIQAECKNTVSVPVGNKGWDFLDDYDKYFDKLSKIYIAVDQDEAGYELETELIRRYNTGNCYKIDLKDCKDANDYLLKYGIASLKETVTHAKLIASKGTKTLTSTKENILKIRKYGLEKGTSTHYPVLDPHFTWRTKEMTLFSGFPGFGKTTYLKNLSMVKSIHDEWKWGVFSPESGSAENYYIELIEVFTGKEVSIKDSKGKCCTDEEFETACDFIDAHFFFVSLENEPCTIENIFKEFQILVKKYGIKGGIIDPFNQLVRHKTQMARDLYVQEFIRDSRLFINKNDFHLAVVEHPKEPFDKGKKTIAEPTQFDIAEGQAWNRGMDNIIILHREDYLENPLESPTKINVRKIRNRKVVGYPGSFYMKFIVEQNRYVQEDNYSPFPNTGNETYLNQKKRRGRTNENRPKRTSRSTKVRSNGTGK